MAFKEIRLDFELCKKGRFFRTLIVHEDIDLIDLGCAIVTAFGGTFEHEFLYETDNISYIPSCFYDEYANEYECLMNDYSLSDLGKHFVFCYDTGEGYFFKASVKDTDIELEADDCAIIDGAGQGIWEDNLVSLIAYFDGKFDNLPIDDALNLGFNLPWNFENEAFSDFDEMFSLAEEIDRFNVEYLVDRDTYRNNEEMCNLEDYDSEDDEMMSMLALMYDSAYENVKEQIKYDKKIKEVYDKLLENHKPKAAKEIIVKEYIFALIKSAKNSEYTIDYKKYIKSLKNLV